MDLTESYPGKSSSTPELHCETLLNASPLHREREFHFMTRCVLDRITGYDGSVLTLKTNSNWRIALVLTCAFGIGGLFYVAILLISPSSIVSAPGWPIVDKRWLVALYGLGVGLVYLPLVAKEIANLLLIKENGTV